MRWPCYKQPDDHPAGTVFLCALDEDHEGDCVDFLDTPQGKELVALAGSMPIRTREEWNTTGAAEFIMGGDNVPDCFLDMQELAARNARRKQDPPPSM